MRASLVLCSILLVASCGRSDLRLGARSKLGRADAGRSDTGLPSKPDAGAMCVLPENGFQLAAVRFDMDGVKRFELAQVTSISPLTFRYFSDQAVFTFNYNDARLFHRVAPGDTLFAAVEIEQPWWTDSRVALFELAPNGGVGDLIAAAWTLGDASGIAWQSELGQAEYTDDDCTPVTEACGTFVTRSLEVSRGDQRVIVATGTETTLGDLVVGNGHSFRFRGQVQCSDLPDGVIAGFVRREI